jgi:tetratricopeptide (TPR) repeat protein
VPEPVPSDPVAALLARGQACEAAGTPAACAEALRCYDTALALLRSAPLAPTLDVAVAWMNRGNVLQLLAPPDFPAALAAYDAAIALLRAAPAADLSAQNSLGAAWMNRGLAAHRLATPESVLDAVRSHAEAIAVLGALPLATNPIFPRNLAAALLNQANALLDSARPELFAAALTAARSAIDLAAPAATTALEFADLTLKARRVLCDTLGQLLTLHESARLPLGPLTAEAGDTVDAGLALARHWEVQGIAHFRPIAVRLFRFGTQLYRFDQTHFLAEFILESLDPTASPGALPLEPEVLAIAADAITRTLATLRAPTAGFQLDDPAHARRLQTWRDLKAAEARLAELASPSPPIAPA